jgi:hypothetical protein
MGGCRKTLCISGLFVFVGRTAVRQDMGDVMVENPHPSMNAQWSRGMGIGGGNKIRTNDLGATSSDLTITPKTRKRHPTGMPFR